MNCWAIILAAGSGTRLAEAGLATRKQFLELEGLPLFWHSALTFAHVARISGLVFVFPPEEFDAAKASTEALLAQYPLNLPCRFAQGGIRRQDSVFNGLEALPADCLQVLVHDSARPFASARLSNTLIDTLGSGAEAAIPAIPVKDTIKRISGSTVAETLPRAELCAVQTPQAFILAMLRKAHEFCQQNQIAVTDDASMVEAMGGSVAIVPGEEDNIKITTPEDLKMLTPKQTPAIPVTGWGYDVHKYGPGRPMVLGGVPIQGAPEVVAHSDGDVLLHALADALLGCLGRGDIGQHFPDTDAAFEGIESSILVNEILLMADKDGLNITHVDLTLICQKPRLAPHTAQIKSSVERLLRLNSKQVNVKATTEEGLGFTGKKLGIKAVACVTATRPAD
ncbi:2-C-methyl-D-erythritol 4-phosphate cytidylyltransferase [Desulfovibrio ferrophilus]|uniref:Bifunctional enzyme IspD/IspF n=1 Tax=Desulfovibrio ferrophilus TaxID=241368 RepID=A0A2Z6AXA4_9BACT|nr:2-C-methyl-D-erythritol 4-phosphate cytidylyltransferase [Desulfovibrio ferrophilus]BBD07835.1 2-C-methyl-D-erythritol 4-phosphatecytidylyltransferase [Desulfovibrio ferrophilus]